MGHVNLKERDGSPARVPLVCRCVVRNGGVATPPPAIDQQRLTAGLVDQVRQMEPAARGRLIEALRTNAADTSKDDLVRQAIAAAAAELTAPEPAQEAPHGDPVL